MIPIIEEMPSKQSFAHRLLGGIQNLGQQGIPAISEHLMGQEKKRQQAQSLKDLTGHDLGALSPDLQKIVVQNLLKGQGKGQNLSATSAALDAMEALIGQSGVGTGGGWNLSPKAAFNRNQFQAAQAGILPLFKQFFPRGFSEKEFLRIMQDWVPQPSDRTSTIKGKIQGLRALLAQQDKSNIHNQLMAGPFSKGPQYQGARTTRAREMRDAEGNVYDIPEEHYEEALSQGLL